MLSFSSDNSELIDSQVSLSKDEKNLYGKINSQGRAQYLPILLHNLSRINTHDKFTLEDAVIAAMIGSKVTSFPKTHDAGYRSLARVV